MIMANIILYQAKALKLCLRTKFNKNLILNQATINDIKQPNNRKINSLLVKLNPVCNKSRLEAANIVGIAKINENSTIKEREIPNYKPPITVAADLDTPGIIARA